MTGLSSDVPQQLRKTAPVLPMMRVNFSIIPMTISLNAVLPIPECLIN